jgi:hypothetical protein
MTKFEKIESNSQESLRYEEEKGEVKAASRADLLKLMEASQEIRRKMDVYSKKLIDKIKDEIKLIHPERPQWVNSNDIQIVFELVDGGTYLCRVFANCEGSDPLWAAEEVLLREGFKFKQDNSFDHPSIVDENGERLVVFPEHPEHSVCEKVIPVEEFEAL